MRSDNKDGILTIFLAGDIDTLNATDVQQEIEEILQNQGDASLVFDARELAYISSAGLRVILTIQKKQHNNISIINLSAEVLGIFKMAGFQYMMELKGV